jgi:hypothetical protein
MTPKAQAASTRNWTKARLMGARTVLIQAFPATEHEKERCKRAVYVIDALLRDWDKNTKELGFNIGPRYKVHFIGSDGSTDLTLNRRELKLYLGDKNYEVTKIE